jgi:hypothetical protein
MVGDVAGHRCLTACHGGVIDPAPLDVLFVFEPLLARSFSD